MHKWIRIFQTGLLVFWSSSLMSQTKPRLIDIQFLQGQPVTQATYGDVTVELKFDQDMDPNVQPAARYGLNETYNLTLPVRGQWENSRLWQGSFTVTNNVPSTGDGLYSFQFFNARSAAGVEMDTTYSKNVNQTTLFICRTGELQLSTTNIDFGTSQPGTVRQAVVNLKNTSCADLTITKLSIRGPFVVLNSPINQTIKGGASINLFIRFYPRYRGVYRDSLVISSNARINKVAKIYLQGTAAGPQMVLIPNTSINFGKASVNTVVTRSLLVINQKHANNALNRPLNVRAIFSTDTTIYSAAPSKFTVNPGDTQRVTVSFRPRQVRAYNNYRLYVQSNDSTQLSRNLALYGDASDNTPPPAPVKITGYWTGYRGYTATDSLRICWTNPNDASGIAEIWWKIIKSPIPPRTPTDTTTAGGRYLLKNGQTCVYLPLRGYISSGRWYVYVWLVDGQGNSGYRNASVMSLVYDVTPPAAPVLLGRSIPVLQWFGYGQPFRLTLRLPKDQALGWADAADIRWKFKSRPNSATDYSGRWLRGAYRGDSLQITIPFTSANLCGDDTLFVWLADSAGNSNPANYTAVRYRFDVCPPEIVRVFQDSLNIATFGEAFRDTLRITDDAGVDTVWFEYRFGGAQVSEPPRPATRIDTTDRYVIEIPNAGVTRRGIEYRVFARDRLKNQSMGPQKTRSCVPDSAWYPIRVQITGDGDFRIDENGRAVPLLAGTDETNYQLFSIPYVLEDGTVMKVLEDDLGKYDQATWRFFDYQPQIDVDSLRWKEGEQARPFEPGRSYFIITRRENVIIDSGPGHTRRTLCPDSIRVYEGWNLIATPFNFPVHKEALSLINSNSIITLRSFERGWNIIDVMEPWKGYAIYVKRAEGTGNRPMYLVVQPKAAAGRVRKATAAEQLQPGEWLVRIMAEAGRVQDRDNWAGVRQNALPGFDDLELVEPPVIGKYVKVAFPRPDWNEPATEFSTDLRPLDSNDRSWTFEVRSNLAHEWITLTFDLSGDFPAGAELYLLDRSQKTAHPLNREPVYRFKTGADGVFRQFTLVAGSRETIREVAGDIELVPSSFAVLQNYPNPFNPETHIRYNLAEPARVTVVVFNQLGQQVRLLEHNAPKPAGYHTLPWDGRDDFGQPVPSGMYFYKVTAGGHTAVRKMLLLK